MIEQLKNASTLTQGFFIAGAGLIGVFLVLVLFFVAIRLIHNIGNKQNKS